MMPSGESGSDIRSTQTQKSRKIKLAIQFDLQRPQSSGLPACSALLRCGPEGISGGAEESLRRDEMKQEQESEKEIACTFVATTRERKDGSVRGPSCQKARRAFPARGQMPRFV